MADTVPFCDLTRALVPIRDEVDAAMRRTVDSGWFLRGPEQEAFEAEWADYCGQAYAVCCNSGTDALTIAALALGLRQAVVQANTLPLTALGLQRGGCAVDLIDVGEDGRIEEAVSDAVPVLLYGRPPGAQEMGAKLFDAAHAHGWKPPRHAAAAWSFYPTKTLGALGDAGAVTTNDKHLAAEMRKLCSRDDVLHDSRQITSRMDELQAAVLRAKLRHLDQWLAERQEIGRLYDARLSVPAINGTGRSLNHLFVIRVADRDELARFLAGRGIGCKVHWPIGLHRQQGAWSRDGAYPSTDAWCDSVLSLPCFPGLRPSEIGFVCDAVLTWLDRHPESRT
ncbi:MAG: DegT/DnrJ/EryC1/StrS family aminotransferase [Hyphomicrobiales bacterium]|nr:DegT/DnrJ/EryC1/StrS family aminotransferase [Hyphomicrobiales bacterium]